MPSDDESPSPLTQAFEPLPEQIGRYRILGRLGAGGMGTVYKAEDPQLGRVVALKLPRFDGPAHDVARRVQRFQREARAAAQIWHPHVCPIHDVGEHEGQPFVVLAYIEGQSLAERLATGRFEDPAQAVDLARQLLDALDAVHAHGIVHRDLKPGNVMLDRSGRAVLMDFGLARPELDGEHLTTDGMVVGTPSYMAPEQAAGDAEHIGPRTDLYALGVVLYQMLTGRLPFEGPALTVLAKIVHEAPPALSALRPDVDPILEEILLKALAKEPERRYQTAREFAAALADRRQETAALGRPPNGGAEGQGSPGEPTAPLTRTGGAVLRPGSRKRRSPLLDWLLMSLLFVAAVGLAVVLLFLLILSSGVLRRFPEHGANLAYPVLIGLVGIVGLFVSWCVFRRSPDPGSALLAAAENGQVEQIKKLIRKRANLEVRDEMGETALMKAAHKGYINTVKLLLANEADVNAKNPFGETALSLATREGRAYIVELLRQAGARE